MEEKRVRIVGQEKGSYRINDSNEIKIAEVSGKFIYNARTLSDYPAAGDYAIALWSDERLWADDTAKAKRVGRPLTDKWTFSTNGVSIQGRYGIPCVGFGPGAESQAHAPNEITWKQDLVVCAALYAAVPMLYKPGD